MKGHDPLAVFAVVYGTVANALAAYALVWVRRTNRYVETSYELAESIGYDLGWDDGHAGTGHRRN